MLDPWYVTGFCDGEAAFTYSRTSGSFGMAFSIKQRQDSRKLIEDLQAFFGSIGNIYEVKESREGKKSGFTKPSVIYRVTRINDLRSVVDHFDKYVLQNQKKLEAYQAWREMVMYKLENYRDIEYDKLRVLAEKLSSLNSKSRAFTVHRK